jgi:hypothetical protein
MPHLVFQPFQTSGVPSIPTIFCQIGFHNAGEFHGLQETRGCGEESFTPQVRTNHLSGKPAFCSRALRQRQPPHFAMANVILFKQVKQTQKILARNNNISEGHFQQHDMLKTAIQLFIYNVNVW